MTADAQNRRDFLKRALTVATGSVCVTGLGLYFRAQDGDDRPSVGAAEGFRDYSVTGGPSGLVLAHGDDRRKLVRAALGALGGMGAFIKPGDRVLLKVNAAFALPPVLGATTHPELVEEISKMCFDAGAREVRVTDNPINDPASCFRLSGIAEAAAKGGARLIHPQSAFFNRITVPRARLIRNWPALTRPFEGIDKVIGLAPVKDHHRSIASMTIKNWYGLLGGRRNVFHQNIHDIIVDLALMIKPTLVILDGVQSMISNGPTGGSLSDLRPTRMLIAGADPVAVDSAGAELLGRKAADIPYLKKAGELGLGVTDYRALRPVDVSVNA